MLQQQRGFRQCAYESCDVAITARHSRTKYCSPKCRAKGNEMLPCSYPECLRHRHSTGKWCRLHGRRRSEGRDMDAPYKYAGTGKPALSIRKRKGGYSKIKRPDGIWQWEHHFVMEQHIGRSLYAHENIHHLNGVKDDNRLCNLELWTRSQPSGQRVVDKLNWAREFLAQYEGQQLAMHDWEPTQ